jgi:hypothetical protein
MKKISTLLFASVAIFATVQLTSCKKDKNNDSATLVGTWQSQTYSYKTTVGGVVTEDTTEAFTTSKITFNSDKTYVTVDLEDSTNGDKGTYSTDGGKLYIASNDGSKDTTNYTVTSTQLTVSGSNTYTYGGVTYYSEDKIIFGKK